MPAQKQKEINVQPTSPIFPQNKWFKKIIIRGGVVILAALAVCIFSIYFLSKETAELEKRVPLPVPESKTTQKTPKISIPKVLYNISGSIKKINENSLILDAKVVYLDEEDRLSQKTEIKRVTITPNTKFSRLAFIPQGEKKVPKETKIFFEDLKVGDYIEVISNQDLSQKERIEASQIRILP